MHMRLPKSDFLKVQGSVQSYNMGVIMGVVWSNPLYDINRAFSSCSNLKMNGISGKSSINWPKSGMVKVVCLDVRFSRY